MARTPIDANRPLRARHNEGKTSPPDPRPIIVVRTYVRDEVEIELDHPEPIVDGEQLAVTVGEFGGYTAWLIERDGEIADHSAGDSPEQFWAWATAHIKGASSRPQPIRKGRSPMHGRWRTWTPAAWQKRTDMAAAGTLGGRGRIALLVCVDANRDLQQLGCPDGFAMVPQPPPACGHAAVEQPLALNRPAGNGALFIGRLRGSDYRGHFDVRQVGNWHTDRMAAGQMSGADATAFMCAWRLLLLDQGWGRMADTRPAQGLRSLRVFLRDNDLDGPRSHTNDDVHAFEWELYKNQRIIRWSDPGGYGPGDLWHYDFTGHYNWVYATCPLPKEPLFWWKDGVPTELVVRQIERGRLVGVQYRGHDGDEHWVCTPDFDAEAVDEVLRCVVYKTSPTSGIAAWARAMFELRARVMADDPVLAKSVKAAINSLWGKFAQTGRRCVPVPPEQVPIAHQRYLLGDEPVVRPPRTDDLHGWRRGFCVSGKQSDGTRQYHHRPPWMGPRDRHFGFAAHVLAYASNRTDELWAAANGVVQAHTDGLWCTERMDPERLAEFAGAAELGGVTETFHRDVEIAHDGSRWIAGECDAQTGGRAREPEHIYLDFAHATANRALLDRAGIDGPGAVRITNDVEREAPLPEMVDADGHRIEADNHWVDVDALPPDVAEGYRRF